MVQASSEQAGVRVVTAELPGTPDIIDRAKKPQ